MEYLELSPQQRRAWVLDRDADVVCRVRTDEPAAAVVARIRTAAARHEVWRTALVDLPGRTVPVQVVTSSVQPGLRVSVIDGGDSACELELRAPRVLADAQSLWLLVCDAAHAADAAPAAPATQFAGWQLELAAEADIVDALTLHETGGAAAFGTRCEATVPASVVGPAAQALGVGAVDCLRAVWRAVVSRLSGVAAPTVGTLIPARCFDELVYCQGRLATMAVDASAVGDRAVADLAADPIPSGLDFALGYERFLGADKRLAFAFSVIDGDALPPGMPVLTELRDNEPCGLCLTGWWRGGTGRLRVIGHGADQVAQRITAALCHLRREPGVRADELDVVLEEEARPIPKHRRAPSTPVGLIVHSAQRWPDAIAVSEDGDQIRYATLLRRAARWTRWLGVAPGEGVGLVMDRSIAQLTALVSVWLAGAAAVIADPRWPTARIEAFFTATGVKAAIVDDRARWALTTGWTVIDVADMPLADSWAPTEIATEFGLPDPRQTAVVLSTSGSTGVPKAVEVEHRSLAAYTSAFLSRHRPGRACWALVSSLSADLGYTGVFGALATGGRLHVVSWSQGVNPDVFADCCRRVGVEALKITPAHLRALLTAADAGDVLPTRLLVCGGDTLSAGLVDRVRTLAPGVEVVNHYGPTEATVGVLTAVVGGDGAPTIGDPLDHISVRLLDDRARPVPAGRTGEVAVSGDGVARGYVGEAGRTAERFRPDPAMPGARTYLTGDLAAVTPAGVRLDGRADRQVKIRGYRVDPEETAAALRATPGVRDAAVNIVGPEDDQGLHAWVQPDDTVFAAELEQAQSALLQHWSAVFAETHSGLPVSGESLISTNGCASCCPGQELSEGEVAERVADVRDVVGARGRVGRVLEIGCGTGLTALALTEICDHYTGTDVVEDLLRYTAEVLRAGGHIDVERDVELLCRPAHDLSGFDHARFDVVVLNSVVQYFPSIGYLTDLLARLTMLVRPGGRIVLASMRDARLLAGFHLRVALAGVDDDADGESVLAQADRARTLDAELAIDPDFFFGLAHRIAGVGVVEVEVPSGRSRNELNDFRYRVVVHVGEDAGATEVVSWRNWRDADGGLDVVLSADDGVVALRGIPDVRTAGACAMAAAAPKCPQARVLRDISARAERGALHPDDLRARAGAQGRQIRVQPGSPGTVDIVAGVGPLPASTAQGRRPGAAVPAERLATAPMLSYLTPIVVAQLKSALAQQLPEYLIPTSMSLVAWMPLRENGKIDVDTLHAPRSDRALAGAYRAPRDELESRIAAIFAEVLGVARVGADDDFFALGGHSLLAIQVFSRIQQRLGTALALRDFFESAATVAAVARAVRAQASTESNRRAVVAPAARKPADGAAISFAQQRILDSPDPQHPVYNIPFAFVMDGKADVVALREAMGEIVARHDGWRYRFVQQDGRWSARVALTADIDVETIDLSDEPTGAVMASASAIASRIAQRRLELASGVTAGAVMRLGERRTGVVLVVHHVVSDGWSTNLFRHELSELYGSAVLGRPPRLPELPVRFADHALAERDAAQTAQSDGDLAWWTARLDGQTPPDLPLPVDRERPDAQTYRGGGLQLRIAPEVVARMRQVSAAHRATLFMFALTAWQVLLHLWTGAAQVTVGTPVAGRRQVEVEALLGCFVNFVLIPVQVDGRDRVGDLLDQVRDQTVAALDHQAAPFSELARRLGDGGALQRPPLFSVMLELANASGQSVLRLPGITLKELPFDHGTSEFELNMVLNEDGDGALAGWLIHRDLFDRATAAWLIERFQAIVAVMVDNPGATVASLAPLVRR